jgi:hypothetical protein
MIRDAQSGSWIRIFFFYPSRILYPGAKKAPDPVSGSATLENKTVQCSRFGRKLITDPDGSDSSWPCLWPLKKICCPIGYPGTKYLNNLICYLLNYGPEADPLFNLRIRIREAN